ncbi:MAG: hypothetical protein E7235_04190 [Lachnospiraceae bacterium]|nr:hypothetical protein [Lachnospiraceae bacterium]
MKKIRLFAMLMGILTVFAFTGCTSGTNGTDGSNGSNGTNSTSGTNGADSGNGIASDIGRMLDGEGSDNNSAIRDTPVRSGIHTNPEYSGVAYGGGYANLGE